MISQHPSYEAAASFLHNLPPSPQSCELHRGDQSYCSTVLQICLKKSLLMVQIPRYDTEFLFLSNNLVVLLN